MDTFTLQVCGLTDGQVYSTGRWIYRKKVSWVVWQMEIKVDWQKEFEDTKGADRNR